MLGGVSLIFYVVFLFIAEKSEKINTELYLYCQCSGKNLYMVLVGVI